MSSRYLPGQGVAEIGHPFRKLVDRERSTLSLASSRHPHASGQEGPNLVGGSAGLWIAKK